MERNQGGERWSLLLLTWLLRGRAQHPSPVLGAPRGTRKSSSFSRSLFPGKSTERPLGQSPARERYGMGAGGRSGDCSQRRTVPSQEGLAMWSQKPKKKVCAPLRGGVANRGRGPRGKKFTPEPGVWPGKKTGSFRFRPGSKMAAPRAPLRLAGPVCSARGVRGLSGTGPPRGSQQRWRTLLRFLTDHFYDVEALRQYLLRKRLLKVQQDNRSFTSLEERYGPSVAGAFFVLKQGGAVKFRDQEWIRPSKHGRFSLEFFKSQDAFVEAVDASGCAINYEGMGSLLSLRELRSLSLQRCPHVDDWCLSRLHPLAASLEELSLAGCPRVSERGLACLHHLQNLRWLDISDLPAVSSPGLTRILVEEMLPGCQVVGADYAQGLRLGPEQQPRDAASPIPA